MTTLVYCKDVIAGDSLQYINAGNNALPLQGPKVFISKDKTFGYGICGHYILEDDRDALESWIAKQIVNGLNGGTVESLLKKGRGFHLIIMTRKGTYCIDHGKPGVTITAINPTDYYVNGTGGDFAILPILEGGDAIDAVKEGKLRDTMSGCDIYAVKRSSLKPRKDM